VIFYNLPRFCLHDTALGYHKREQARRERDASLYLVTTFCGHPSMEPASSGNTSEQTHTDHTCSKNAQTLLAAPGRWIIAVRQCCFLPQIIHIVICTERDTASKGVPCVLFLASSPLILPWYSLTKPCACSIARLGRVCFQIRFLHAGLGVGYTVIQNLISKPFQHGYLISFGPCNIRHRYTTKLTACPLRVRCQSAI